MPKFDVEFYETAEGDQPAREFMLSLDRKMRAKKYRADYLDSVKPFMKNGRPK